jgi:lipoprotein-releasing system permease protein
MFEFWIVWRYMATRKGQFFNLVSILAIVGMALGVTALVIVMSVISGFESTLKSAVVDVTGHILILKRGEALEPMDTFGPRLKKIVPEISSMMPFVHVEGIVAHRGKISSVVVEGFPPSNADQTLKLKNRIVSGTFDLGTGYEKVPPIIVGGALASKLGVKVGELLNVVLPKNNPNVKTLGFSNLLTVFKVVGIIDLGMYEYDSRFLLTSDHAAQKLAGIGNVYTGLRIKLTDDKFTRDASFNLSTELGVNYLCRDWQEINHNLFEAIKLERVVIFIVLLFMTVAACFNISSTLFVSVLRRYGELSIFKTLGATKRRLVLFFTLQGLFIGVIGSLAGLLLGSFICLIIAKTNLIYVPAEIYHIHRLPVQMRPLDMLLIFVVSFILCLISTLAPAFRGAKLDPVEGLKYD